MLIIIELSRISVFITTKITFQYGTKTITNIVLAIIEKYKIVRATTLIFSSDMSWALGSLITAARSDELLHFWPFSTTRTATAAQWYEWQWWAMWSTFCTYCNLISSLTAAVFHNVSFSINSRTGSPLGKHIRIQLHAPKWPAFLCLYVIQCAFLSCHFGHETERPEVSTRTEGTLDRLQHPTVHVDICMRPWWKLSTSAPVCPSKSVSACRTSECILHVYDVSIRFMRCEFCITGF